MSVRVCVLLLAACALLAPAWAQVTGLACDVTDIKSGAACTNILATHNAVRAAAPAAPALAALTWSKTLANFAREDAPKLDNSTPPKPLSVTSDTVTTANLDASENTLFKVGDVVTVGEVITQVTLLAGETMSPTVVLRALVNNVALAEQYASIGQGTCSTQTVDCKPLFQMYDKAATRVGCAYHVVNNAITHLRCKYHPAPGADKPYPTFELKTDVLTNTITGLKLPVSIATNVAPAPASAVFINANMLYSFKVGTGRRDLIKATFTNTGTGPGQTAVFSLLVPSMLVAQSGSITATSKVLELTTIATSTATAAAELQMIFKTSTTEAASTWSVAVTATADTMSCLTPAAGAGYAFATAVTTTSCVKDKVLATGTTCSATCATGFTGTGVGTCTNGNLVFSGCKSTSCTYVKKDGYIPAKTGGCTDNLVLQNGGKCSVQCDAANGFAVAGTTSSFEITCTDGTLSAFPAPGCAKKCKLPDFNAERYTSTACAGKTEILSGESCAADCKTPAYTGTSTTLTCKDGVLSGKPVCKASCTLPSNTNFNYDVGATTAEKCSTYTASGLPSGTTCKMSCANKEGSFTCNDGTLTGGVAGCDCKLNYETSLYLPKEGSLTKCGTVGTTLATTKSCELQCQSGTTASGTGTTTLTCKDGVTTLTGTKCVKGCIFSTSVVETSAGFKLKATPGDTDCKAGLVVTEGSSCNLECDPATTGTFAKATCTSGRIVTSNDCKLKDNVCRYPDLGALLSYYKYKKGELIIDNFAPTTDADLVGYLRTKYNPGWVGDAKRAPVPACVTEGPGVLEQEKECAFTCGVDYLPPSADELKVLKLRCNKDNTITFPQFICSERVDFIDVDRFNRFNFDGNTESLIRFSMGEKVSGNFATDRDVVLCTELQCDRSQECRVTFNVVLKTGSVEGGEVTPCFLRPGLDILRQNQVAQCQYVLSSKITGAVGGKAMALPATKSLLEPGDNPANVCMVLRLSSAKNAGAQTLAGSVQLLFTREGGGGEPVGPFPAGNNFELNPTV